MKYFKNDIIEIVTAKYNSWNDIPNHEKGYFETQKLPAFTRGQRFTITGIGNSGSRIVTIVNGGLVLGVKLECVTLYKSPWYNWFKQLFFKEKKVNTQD